MIEDQKDMSPKPSSGGDELGFNRRSFLEISGAGFVEAVLLPVPESISSWNFLNQAPQKHPFLLCTRDQFPALRERAEREPWATMADNAVQAANDGLDAADGGRSAIQLQTYLGACALAYIVDPDNQARYAGAIYDGIVGDLAETTFDESEAWSGVVPPMAAAFVGIVALDVVYDDLSAAQVQECEYVIDTQIGKISEEGGWLNGRRGTHGTWEVYRGERTEPDDVFYERYLEQMTDDGVATTASSYAWSRLGSSGSRPQKTGYADVLEFTGIDTRYYDHPRLQRFYRWLFGSAVTPAKHLHAFGDFFIFGRYPLDEGQTEQLENASLTYRAGRFDPQAGRYAAWALEDRTPPGHILAYVPKTERYDPAVPTSTLYEDGGAFFREATHAPESLGAMLYNITERAGWHAHQETNALSLSAYGGRLLVSAGWLGPVTRPARRNNTLTINGAEHETRTGAGLREGLTSEGLDYAVGHSGDALPGNAWFERSLLLVHGQGEARGYFVTIDEVQAAPDDTIQHALHPATSTAPETIEAGLEYEAAIDRFTEVDGNRLSVVYGRAPEEVVQASMPTGSERADAQEHVRQEAHFRANQEGEARLVTVLFPHAAEHEDLRFTRRGSGEEPSRSPTGVSIAHEGGAVDHVYESAGYEEQEGAAGARFRGRVALYRVRGEETPFYFVRRGTDFRRATVGFEADQRVSLQLRGTTGQITAADATALTVYQPGVTGVQVAGTRLDPLERTEGRVRVPVPAGSNQPITLLEDG